MTKACGWDERRVERNIHEEDDMQEGGGDHGGG